MSDRGIFLSESIRPAGRRCAAFQRVAASPFRAHVAGILKPTDAAVLCRPHCGACCIAPSISSPMPKMPNGKKAGERCLHLLDDLRCELFGRPERPAVCVSLRPTDEMCGASREHALAHLAALESATRPHV